MPVNCSYMHDHAARGQFGNRMKRLFVHNSLLYDKNLLKCLQGLTGAIQTDGVAVTHPCSVAVPSLVGGNMQKCYRNILF